VASVALGDMHLRLAWQAWHLATSTFVLRGKRGTWQHPPSFRVAVVALGGIMRHPPSLCVAGVALGDIRHHFGHRWKLCGSHAGMFRMFRLAQRGKRPCACLMETLGSDAAGMFRMFRFGPTWEEALCMFDGNFVEAMPAYFVCFAVAHRGERGLAHV